jgi:hypothetical protein
MKNLIVCLSLLLIVFSCRTQKSTYVDEEISLGLDTTESITSKIPCRNRIYCNESLSEMYEDYPKYNVFRIKFKNGNQDFILPVKQGKENAIDTTQIIILDTLQFNCSCLR